MRRYVAGVLAALAVLMLGCEGGTDQTRDRTPVNPDRPHHLLELVVTTRAPSFRVHFTVTDGQPARRHDGTVVQTPRSGQWRQDLMDYNTGVEFMAHVTVHITHDGKAEGSWKLVVALKANGKAVCTREATAYPRDSLRRASVSCDWIHEAE